MRSPTRGGGMRTPLQAAIVVSMLAVVQGRMVADEDCKCFMCICDLDPHPLPPEMPPQHHPPPPDKPEPVPSPPPSSPSPPPPSPSPPPPAPAAVVVPATTYYPPPTGYYYYTPPQPYGYPWPTTYGYGPPVGEMYPRVKSGAARRHGGCGRSRLVLAVALASAVLSLLLLPA